MRSRPGRADECVPTGGTPTGGTAQLAPTAMLLEAAAGSPGLGSPPLDSTRVAMPPPPSSLAESLPSSAVLTKAMPDGAGGAAVGRLIVPSVGAREGSEAVRRGDQSWS